MFSWIWAHLPGSRWLRFVLMLIGIVLIIYVLFEFTFPWVYETYYDPIV